MVAIAARLRRTHAAAAVAAFLVLAVLGGAGFLLLRDRDATFAAVVDEQDNITLGLERDILRNIDIYDLSLRAASSGLSFMEGIEDGAVRNALLFDGAALAQFFRPIVISDSTGRVTFRSGTSAAPVASVSGRMAFQAHRSRDDLGLLVRFVDDGASGGNTYLQLTRRILAPDGGFGGVVGGGIEVSYFKQAFSAIKLPPDSLMAVVGLDGRVVASVPVLAGQGRMATNGAMFTKALAAGGHGSFKATGVTSGIARIVSVRRLGSLPFFIMVGTPEAAAFAEMELRAWGTAIGLLAFVSLSSLLLFALERELTRRRKAEAAAVAAGAAALAGEARLNTYVDHLADGVLVIRRRLDGRFVHERLNAAASAMLGLDPAEAIGRNAEGYGSEGLWPVPLGEMVAAQWGHANRDALRFERVHVAGGARRVLRIAVAPVHAPQPDGTAAVALLLVSVRDVTDAVEMENRLRQSQRMEAVGQLTAGVAHDFNNMLQAQMGALELLLDEVADSPRATELAQLALGAGGHGARLTHSLLSFSRQQHLAPRPVLAAAMLDRLGQMLAHTLSPQIRLRITAQDGMAAPFADAAQLEAALLNLALNARDAMADGGELHIEAREPAPGDAPPCDSRVGKKLPGRCVVLAVSDTGEGMTPDVAARACEPFFTTKGVGKGSGLGLSMVQGFVQQSGGALRIVSAPGKGTRVELWLPAAAAQASAAPAAADPGLPARPGQGAGRVLLVDDNADVLAVTVEILEGAGFTVIPAASGDEALALLRSEQPFDVLVTDYVMPGLDGGRLIEQVHASCPGLPTLVVTGHTDAEVLSALPPDVSVMHKPVRGSALARQVSDMVAVQSAVHQSGVRPSAGCVQAGPHAMSAAGTG